MLFVPRYLKYQICSFDQRTTVCDDVIFHIFPYNGRLTASSVLFKSMSLISTYSTSHEPALKAGTSVKTPYF